MLRPCARSTSARAPRSTWWSPACCSTPAPARPGATRARRPGQTLTPLRGAGGGELRAVHGRRVLQRPRRARCGPTPTALRGWSPTTLAARLPGRADNPLVGLDGRARCCAPGRGAARPARAVRRDEPRRAACSTRWPAQRRHRRARRRATILAAVLDGLGAIWPGRLTLAGVNLGDVWPHPAAGGDGPGRGLVPFHKLSQWLTYSLLEPLERARASRSATSTRSPGCAEYRNGGLFSTLGVLCRATRRVASGAASGSRRGRGRVARADRGAARSRWRRCVRERLGLEPPTCRWRACSRAAPGPPGRASPRERRADGGPPLRVDSDGTVF